MTTEKKSYDIDEVIAAAITLEPIKCRHCGDVEGNVTYHDSSGDAYCSMCGKWQLDD